MNVVLVMFRDGERREFPLAADQTVLGRKQDCGLRIPTRDVSREHCELTIKGDTLHAKDLGSSNGTFINGKRIAEADLKPGDELKIGPVNFIVQIDGEPAKIEAPDSRSSAVATAGPDDEEETFELSEDDFDLDDPMSALEAEEDEDDMP
jgi:adenylate cyclase